MIPTIINSFQFVDLLVNKIDDLELGVEGNTATFPLDMAQLHDSHLSMGESIRTKPFSVIQTDHPWLSGLSFELRIYPLGQPNSPAGFIVYLVLTNCPDDQHAIPELRVMLSFHGPGKKHKGHVKSKKVFDWTSKQDRWLRLEFPARKIPSQNLWFSMNIGVVDDKNTNNNCEITNSSTDQVEKCWSNNKKTKKNGKKKNKK